MGGRLSLRHCPTRAGGNAVRVVIMEHIPTPSSTVGPFLHLGLTEKHSITHIAAPNVKGEHISLAIYSRGILLQLYTRIYFAADSANEHDPVLALVPKERRSTLMAHPDSSRSGHWLFDIRLRGENETVFFDV